MLNLFQYPVATPFYFIERMTGYDFAVKTVSIFWGPVQYQIVFYASLEKRTLYKNSVRKCR